MLDLFRSPSSDTEVLQEQLAHRDTEIADLQGQLRAHQEADQRDFLSDNSEQLCAVIRVKNNVIQELQAQLTNAGQEGVAHHVEAAATSTAALERLRAELEAAVAERDDARKDALAASAAKALSQADGRSTLEFQAMLRERDAQLEKLGQQMQLLHAERDRQATLLAASATTHAADLARLQAQLAVMKAQQPSRSSTPAVVQDPMVPPPPSGVPPAEFTRLQAELASKNTALTEREQQVTQLQQQLQQLQRSITDPPSPPPPPGVPPEVLAKLQASSTVQAELEDKQVLLVQREQQLHAAISERDAAVQAAADVATGSAEVARMQTETERLLQQLAAQERELVAAREVQPTIAAQEQALQEMREQHLNASESASASNMESQQLQVSLATQEQELMGLRKQLASAASVTNLQHEELQGQLEQAVGLASSSRADAEGLQSTVDEHQQELDELREQSKRSAQLSCERHEELTLLRDQHFQANDLASSAATENSSLHATVAVQDQELVQLRQQHSQTVASASASGAEIADLQARVGRATQAASASGAQANELQATVSELRAQLLPMSQLLKTLASERDHALATAESRACQATTLSDFEASCANQRSELAAHESRLIFVTAERDEHAMKANLSVSAAAESARSHACLQEQLAELQVSKAEEVAKNLEETALSLDGQRAHLAELEARIELLSIERDQERESASISSASASAGSAEVARLHATLKAHRDEMAKQRMEAVERAGENASKAKQLQSALDAQAARLLSREQLVEALTFERDELKQAARAASSSRQVCVAEAVSPSKAAPSHAAESSAVASSGEVSIAELVTLHVGAAAGDPFASGLAVQRLKSEVESRIGRPVAVSVDCHIPVGWGDGGAGDGSSVEEAIVLRVTRGSQIILSSLDEDEPLTADDVLEAFPSLGDSGCGGRTLEDASPNGVDRHASHGPAQGVTERLAVGSAVGEAAELRCALTAAESRLQFLEEELLRLDQVGGVEGVVTLQRSLQASECSLSAMKDELAIAVQESADVVELRQSIQCSNVQIQERDVLLAQAADQRHVAEDREHELSKELQDAEARALMLGARLSEIDAASKEGAKELQEAHKLWANERADLKMQIDRLTDALSGLTEALERAQAETEALRGEKVKADTLAEALANSETRLQTLLAEGTRLQKSSDVQSERTAQLEGQLGNSLGSDQTTGSGGALLSSDRAELEKARTNAAREVQAARGEASDARRTVEELTAKVQRLESQLSRCKIESEDSRRSQAVAERAAGIGTKAIDSSVLSQSGSETGLTGMLARALHDVEQGDRSAITLADIGLGSITALPSLDICLQRLSALMAVRADARLAVFGIWILCHSIYILYLLYEHFGRR